MFRQEALDAQHAGGLGEIVLIRPISFTFLTLLAAAMALLVVGFFLFGSYTKRSTVSGQLVPASGQVKVHAPQAGIVLRKFVQEGQAVRRGERLMVLSSERYGSDAGPVQAGISRRLEQRRDSLRDELEKLRRLQDDERDSLTSKVASLQRELTTLAAQTDSQQRLLALASDAAARYQGLMDKGYISMDQLQQRQAELLGQRQTLQGLERERTSLRQQLTERRNELAGLSARQANQLAETRRQLSAVEQDLAESEAKRTLLVTAPESGIATAVLAEAGQTVDSSRPLLSIVPADTPLQAELYAPSKSIGFIRPGDAVLIRYQAYPYQKFGQYHGKVQSISRASISYAELSSMVGGVPGLGQDGEQLYRLRVTLDDQAVTAYGQPRPLQSGMLLEADILQDTRRLYEWVLEPLYSLTGKL
ncbi:HlyD family efflux transporter periplasmic adaptor subunit [Pseudomonas aeruginosa]|uniref:HlyD family secretion protein n=6 Tax=Pseudomonas aeruginosa TaxID=287 RepID=UPI0021F2010D|nr:HlyD family efflux transporter periplasmic adaptor subunit [Pseudomonas aeruginosa]MCV4157497.1 HlyD family efflux transporter periplasmic adaptor subunit [Pseudomonas aeruginosa]HBO5136907.1 HlyD family efflux transporter periplasmic adaptor subunit [Pseudomonas aeruginosa]HCR1639789.1 HlyD family efflux transporter periplasmic adaptor subunit [Pseudomonas aeruginosa]HDZ3446402.1 HlyD family efflux transporter periplasmic adaptor subunit [Pseudomonas aeruginosa]